MLGRGHRGTGWSGFNPRPAPRSGAIDWGLTGLTRQWRFQSAPRSEERGDALFGRIKVAEEVSIRAPLRGAGRWALMRRVRRVSEVSIRAPLRGAGR